MRAIAELQAELAVLKSEILAEVRKGDDELKVQLKALQFGGAIAAFALGAIVLLTRMIG